MNEEQLQQQTGQSSRSLWKQSRRINANPRNVYRTSTGRPIGVMNPNGSISKIASNLGMPTGAFYQTRADKVLQARVDGTFDAKRQAFNRASKDSVMDEKGNIVAKEAPNPNAESQGGTTEKKLGARRRTPSPAADAGATAAAAAAAPNGAAASSASTPPKMVSVPGAGGGTKAVLNPAAMAKPAGPAQNPAQKSLGPVLFPGTLGRINDGKNDVTRKVMDAVARSHGLPTVETQRKRAVRQLLPGTMEAVDYAAQRLHPPLAPKPSEPEEADPAHIQLDPVGKNGIPFAPKQPAQQPQTVASVPAAPVAPAKPTAAPSSSTPAAPPKPATTIATAAPQATTTSTTPPPSLPSVTAEPASANFKLKTPTGIAGARG